MNPTPDALCDLHRHLDGSLRADTARELARNLGLEVPPALGFHAGMGLHEALDRFAFTVSLLGTTSAIARVASEMCEDAHADGVGTLEIRFAPQLHGVGVAAAVDAAIEGVAGRAGLILCGLYGEDPGVLEALVDVASTRPAVVGVDLAGGPAPSHRFGMRDYAAPFRRAATLGLGTTVHAGEGRAPEEIRVAIEVLGAQRIGHGTTLLADPEVVALVRERGVTIEACPTSNVHVGVIGHVRDHPLGRWLALGLRVCVCTDNTLLSDVTLTEELRRVRAIEGVGEAEIAAMVAFGHAAAFRRA